MVQGDLLEDHFLVGGKETSPDSVNKPIIRHRSLITVLIHTIEEIRQRFIIILAFASQDCLDFTCLQAELFLESTGKSRP